MSGGRPSFKPTDEQRRLVEELSGIGTPQESIARIVGVSMPTLRLHFRDELDLGADKANAEVARSLYNRAVLGAGKEAVTAAIFWLKTRAGWRERDDTGKKQEAEAAAKTAERGTNWETLLQ